MDELKFCHAQLFTILSRRRHIYTHVLTNLKKMIHTIPCKLYTKGIRKDEKKE